MASTPTPTVQDGFTYTLDGTDYRLPLIGDLPPYLLQGLEDEGKPLTGLRSILDEYAPGLFRALPNAAAINDLMEAWQAASGATLGESSASAAS